jgi:hypothetical protein
LRRVLELAAGQHGVVSREQLLTLGMSAAAIRHRVRRGRLDVIYPGVYALGDPSSRFTVSGWQPCWRVERERS